MFEILKNHIAIAFSLLLFSQLSLAAVLDNAIPNDAETEVVLASDPNDFFFQPFTLLLTNNTGYKIQCSNNEALLSMLEGLGLSTLDINLMRRVSVDSSEVVNSYYDDNAVLNCERGPEELYVIEYPEGDLKYFIDFSGDTGLNMVGCQGLLDAMGFNTEEAIPLSYDIAQRFFDVSNDLDIHCTNGVQAGPLSCGERNHGSSWQQPINNGSQIYACDDGVEQPSGFPICDDGYEISRNSCVYIPLNCEEQGRLHGATWTENISGGIKNNRCNDGVVEEDVTCLSDFIKSGDNQCTRLPLALGDNYGCAIKADNTLACWGRDFRGEATVPDGLDPVIALATGDNHTCVITRDQSLNCWGNEYHDDTLFPTNLGPVEQVTAGSNFTCAIKTNGTLACWGMDYWDMPIFPADLGLVTSAALGSFHICAIKADRSLACWGDDSVNQISDMPTDLGEVLSVSVGGWHTCAIKADHSVACWGHNDENQSDVPTDLGAVIGIGTGKKHNCAIKEDSSLVCWGKSDYGQISMPNDLGPVLAVEAGFNHTCALKTDNTVTCWGANQYRQSNTPTDLGTLLN